MVAGSRHFQLLIADDDPAMRETLVEMLQPEFETIDVDSGEEAIEVVERREIDLALVDLHMPVVTGIDVLRFLRQLRRSLPCILMSANWTDPLKTEAVASRAAGVLQKPMTRLELVTTVTTALGRAQSEVWTPDAERTDGLHPETRPHR